MFLPTSPKPPKAQTKVSSVLLFILFIVIVISIVYNSKTENKNYLKDDSDLSKKDNNKGFVVKEFGPRVQVQEHEIVMNNMKEEKSGIEETEESRFYMLTQIDRQYEGYVPPKYNNKISLEELCNEFRNFSCSRLKLYYDIII